jgi:hypothetical protein
MLFGGAVELMLLQYGPPGTTAGASVGSAAGSGAGPTASSSAPVESG